MSQKAKKKLCWNCEGNVSLQDTLCPYCGVSLEVSPFLGAGLTDPAPSPPYKLMSGAADNNIPTAPYASQSSDSETVKEESIPLEEAASPSTNDFQSLVLTISTLMLGLIFVLFGFILFVFSNSQGVFTLHWQGAYWYIYVLLGLPLLYFGWRMANLFKEPDDS